MRRRLWTALVAVCLAAPSVARAGDVVASVGAGGGASTWPDDPNVHSSMKIGYRFGGWLSLDYTGRLGYGQVDERLLFYFSVGAEAWGRLGDSKPRIRLGLVHMHEEPRDAVEASPFATLLGTADGIRHRAGASATAGWDFPIGRSKLGPVYLAFDATTTYFPDNRGPAWYLDAAVSVAFDYLW